jgi:hypothetical protein
MFNRRIKQYGADVPIARQPKHAVEPVKRLAALNEFFGKWVAVKDGEVIAFSDTSRGLAFELQQLRSRNKDSVSGAVMQFVLEPSATVMVGLG